MPVEGVDRLRWVKDADELARIEQAVAIADAAFAHVQSLLQPGAVERERFILFSGHPNLV